MNIKKVIKKMLCPIQCFRFGVKNQAGNLYIGKGCKIVNPKAMSFGKMLASCRIRCLCATREDT